MSGCINDSGEVTPKGKHISQHLVDSITRHRKGHDFSWSYIDTVIDNPLRSAIQPDGRVIYLYRQPMRRRLYSIVILENGDCIVTAARDLENNDLEGMAKKNNWLGLRY